MSILVASITVDVVKKNIKNLHLVVLPPDGRVRVSAPSAMSDESIAMFVRTRLGWIRKQQEKFTRQPRQSEREYVSGETLYVWGRQYYLQTAYNGNNSLLLSGDKAILTVRKGSTPEQRESYTREWYRGLLKEEIAKLLPKLEEKTGLKASSWQTKYMSTRWGTCNTETGKIWLNLQLAKKTPECLEYVIIHELVHLVEKSHNSLFISLMDKHLPMWREVKATLNGQTLDYME